MTTGEQQSIASWRTSINKKNNNKKRKRSSHTNSTHVPGTQCRKPSLKLLHRNVWHDLCDFLVSGKATTQMPRTAIKYCKHDGCGLMMRCVKARQAGSSAGQDGGPPFAAGRPVRASHSHPAPLQQLRSIGSPTCPPPGLLAASLCAARPPANKVGRHRVHGSRTERPAEWIANLRRTRSLDGTDRITGHRWGDGGRELSAALLWYYFLV